MWPEKCRKSPGLAATAASKQTNGLLPFFFPCRTARCRPKLLPDWLARTPYGLRFRTQDELRAMGIAP